MLAFRATPLAPALRAGQHLSQEQLQILLSCSDSVQGEFGGKPGTNTVSIGTRAWRLGLRSSAKLQLYPAVPRSLVVDIGAGQPHRGLEEVVVVEQACPAANQQGAAEGGVVPSRSSTFTVGAMLSFMVVVVILLMVPCIMPVMLLLLFCCHGWPVWVLTKPTPLVVAAAPGQQLLDGTRPLPAVAGPAVLYMYDPYCSPWSMPPLHVDFLLLLPSLVNPSMRYPLLFPTCQPFAGVRAAPGCCW